MVYCITGMCRGDDPHFYTEILDPRHMIFMKTLKRKKNSDPRGHFFSFPHKISDPGGLKLLQEGGKSHNFLSALKAPVLHVLRPHSSIFLTPIF